MIINKGSLERGFAHGQIYKTEVCAFFANQLFQKLRKFVHIVC